MFIKAENIINWEDRNLYIDTGEVYLIDGNRLGDQSDANINPKKAEYIETIDEDGVYSEV